MSTPNDIAELLRKGIAAKRENKREEARGFFEQVVELDENNEKGWFWLASVVDSDEERRICLSNVLHLNPNNVRAKTALETLQGKSREQKTVSGGPEVVAGITRRQMTVAVGGGILVVLVVLIVTLVVIIGNNNRQNAERATQTAVAEVATGGALTAIAAADQATGTAVAILATQAALITPTVPTPNIPTLPPTWTPTPVATLPPTRAALPLPTGLTGDLAVWGGQDLTSTGYLPIGYYNFDIANQYTQIGKSLGRDVSFAPSGQRVVYTDYDVLLFSTSLEAVNLNGTQIESLPNRWKGQNIFAPQQPRFGPQGLSVVFVATTQTRNTTQVFLLNLNTQGSENPVKQMTDDDAIYTFPSLSPDGSKIAVVRSDPNSITPTTDIISIDVATGGEVPITNDGGSYVETSPHYTRDGSQVFFAAAPSNDPNNSDLYIRNSNGTGSTLPLYRTTANDLYPVLSPDGHYLAFASNPTGAYDIYIYDQNTQTLFQLTNTPDNEYPGDWWQP